MPGTYINPTETGLYYLNSRYYDPEIGRFVNTDAAIGQIGNVQGNNMFVYCFNNPVNMSDSSGHWPQWIKDAANWVNDNLIRPVERFVEDIVEDHKNYNKYNESEEKVLESNYFSSYKGKLVVRTNLERSGSYGALFISRKAAERTVPEDEIRHEYGHTKQLDQLGFAKYTLCIGLPSLFEWGSDSEYYRRPWEITADIYGGVQSRSYPEYETAGFEYLENSRKWGILVWLTID